MRSLHSLRPTPHYWLRIPRQHKGLLTFPARALWLQAIPALHPAWSSQWTEDLSTLGPFLGFLYRGWLPYLPVFVFALLGHCVWSMALDRETWWGSCPICCMHVPKNSFFLITNAGPIQPPYPLGLQNTNMQPKSPKPLSVPPHLHKLFISSPCVSITEFFRVDPGHKMPTLEFQSVKDGVKPIKWDSHTG